MPGTMKDVSAALATEVCNMLGLNDDGDALSTLFKYVSHGTVVAGNKLSPEMDSVYDALMILMGRLYMAVREYPGKLKLIDSIDTGMFTDRLAKISFGTKYALPSGAFNTDLYTNLADGYDNGSNSGNATASMWEQHYTPVFELAFSGSSTWQDCLTRPLEAIKKSFRNQEEFSRFWEGVITEKMNDIELEKEAFRRFNLLSSIGSRYAAATSASYSQPGHDTMAINLTAGYNAKFGTNYTSEQLRTTYLKEFLAYFTAEFKAVSDKMTIKSAFYHFTLSRTVGSDTYYLTRHTPKEMQRAFLYAPLFRDAESLVMPEIFHDNYLDRPNGELVEYWQTFTGDSDTSAEIKASVKVFDDDENATEIDIPYVVAFLYDRDALMTDYQLEDAIDTVPEARKRYVNTWWTFAKNNINDISENGVVFYMADPAAGGDAAGGGT